MADASQPNLIREEHGEYKITPEQQAEKEAYRARLRAFLEDPASRQIEGFPIGEIEDILALSDPPYYTACPNPFLAEILEKWEKEKREQRIENSEQDDGTTLYSPVSTRYHREPFATDVSEGKNDPIYNAHSYHTKVPHKAIMRYILHYTEPGDIVFDGFCGTGMTGVAAQLCGDKKTVESLGYRVDDEENIYASDDRPQTKDHRPQTVDGQPSIVHRPLSKLGARKALLVDLSPAATFIAYNYNTPVDVTAFEPEALRIIQEVEQECGWMYETIHTDGKTKGRINFTILSDAYVCPQCNTEMVFWDVAVDKDTKTIRDDWLCPRCSAHLSKRPDKNSDELRVERVWQTIFDRNLRQTVRLAKQVPVIINYSVGKSTFEKTPDDFDLSIVQKIDNSEFSYSFPTNALPDGLNTQQPKESHGLTNIHQFYTRRSLWLSASLWGKIAQVKNERTKTSLFFLWQSLALGFTKLNRYGATHYSQVNRTLTGTLYVSSIISEVSLHYAFNGKLKRLSRAFRGYQPVQSRTTISACSATTLGIGNNSLDYIFVDPPFGGNLMYSELNFIWESWLKVQTNNQPEAIINRVKHKGLPDYQQLMAQCFHEFYRVLKPGHWMTVEFHNSQNSIWNSIQEAISRAGFVIADVRTLDKQQSSFKQVTTTAAVKQDLVISAYKPNDNLEERFRLEARTSEGAWDFIRYHLGQLPRVVEKDDEIEVVAERQAYLLFDRMVAFHIQRGASVPLSASEFYAGLKQRFAERDGMYFLPDQVAEYDSARLRLGRVAQLALFVSDEKTAIQWLRQQLEPSLGGKPRTFAELQPEFMQEAHKAGHEQMPELGEILEQNFLEDEHGHWYPPNASKASDLERLRLRALLKEFATYLEGRGRLRQFRTEAVRAGFAEAYRDKKYAIILQVAARLPEDVLHEDPDLLMYYDTASLRTAN